MSVAVLALTSAMYKVEVEATHADWGTVYVANVQILNDVCLYRIGPYYTLDDLCTSVLNRFGKRR